MLYEVITIRGGLQNIPHGQIEAGLAIGMSRWTLLRRVIAPVTLRLALPAYSTEAILLVKSTALASLVTVWDVTGVITSYSIHYTKLYESDATHNGRLFENMRAVP